MLHCLEIHFESFQVDQQQFGPLLDHHLPCCHLLGVAILTVELVPDIEQLLSAELFEAIAQ